MTSLNRKLFNPRYVAQSGLGPIPRSVNTLPTHGFSHLNFYCA